MFHVFQVINEEDGDQNENVGDDTIWHDSISADQKYANSKLSSEKGKSSIPKTLNNSHIDLTLPRHVDSNENPIENTRPISGTAMTGQKRKNDSSNDKSPKSQATGDNSMFTLNETKRQENKKFKNEQVWYKIEVNEKAKRKTIVDMRIDLNDTIQKAIDEVSSRHQASDLMRIHINHPNFYSPSRIKLTPIPDLKAETVLRKMKLLNHMKTDLNIIEGIELIIGVQQIRN